MKVLLDTNILIAIDPTSEDYVQQTSREAARLVQLASKAGVQLCIHPAQRQDFDNDMDERRRNLRTILSGKYLLLDPPPPVPKKLEQILGEVDSQSNHYVDHQLISAVAAPAVDYLITEDRQILNKASRTGYRDRVLSLSEAVDILAALSDNKIAAPPAVRVIKAYELNREDPIWDSLENDYSGFQEWLANCAREGRDGWLIERDGGYATVVIINREKDLPVGISGKVLKICTFKASEQYHGLRFGELMLKTIFRHAHENRYDWVFIESFPKQEALINLFSEFGFTKIGEKMDGQHILAKPLRPGVSGENLSGLQFHRRFGPEFVDWRQPAFLIPIQPQFDKLLFPDQQEQRKFFEGENAFGNAIRKAYLSHSNIQQIKSGSLLFFYRSVDLMAITTLGVAEKTLRSSDESEVAAFVARRTVYSMEEIREKSRKPVLAIQFRHAKLIAPHIRLQDLKANGILSAAPESIMSIRDEAKEWLKTRVDR